MRICIDDLSVMMSVSAMQCDSNQSLKIKEFLFADPIEIDQLFIGVVNYFHFTRLFAKENGSASEEGLTVQNVFGDFGNNNGEKSLLPSVVTDWCLCVH